MPRTSLCALIVWTEKVSPLAALGWTEADCRRWCEENGLLSPIYTSAARGGCWFCHNQSVAQLRILRSTYPELWALLLKWDADSPVSFKPDRHTVHDYEERFALEEQGFISASDPFKWRSLEFLQLSMDCYERIHGLLPATKQSEEINA